MTAFPLLPIPVQMLKRRMKKENKFSVLHHHWIDSMRCGLYLVSCMVITKPHKRGVVRIALLSDKAVSVAMAVYAAGLFC